MTPRPHPLADIPALPMAPDPQPAAGPWHGLALAAQAAVEHLQHRSGWDLCLVSTAEEDRQAVLASAGSWRTFVRPGDSLGWPATELGRLIGAGVAISHLEQRSGTLALDPLPTARSYVGAPLLEADGTLFGTVCALDQQPVPLAMAEVFEEVRILARMLSTIRAGEEVAADRSAAAASAYALATRDGLTGLLNRRGWSAALDVEEHRARRYGRAVSVVVLDVDGLKQFNDHAGHLAGDQVLVACARAIGAACRPGDAPARLGGDEFAVLAVECDVVCARALSARLRRELLRAGVLASVGFATRRIGEDLTATLHRADQAMYRMKRQQRARRQPIPESSGVGLGSRVADRAP